MKKTTKTDSFKAQWLWLILVMKAAGTGNHCLQTDMSGQGH
jgi:hypothetical protein